MERFTVNKTILTAGAITCALLLSACSSPTSKIYGMDYEVKQSRAGNIMQFFGIGPVPIDTKAPQGFYSVTASSEQFDPRWIQKESHETPSTRVVPAKVKTPYTYTGLLEAMDTVIDPTDARDNQFFGFVDSYRIRGTNEAQKKFLSQLTRAFFTGLRKTRSDFTFHLDVIRPRLEKDRVVHSMVIFFENESLGCKYNPRASDGAPVGSCGVLFVSKTPLEARPTLIPLAIGGKKEQRTFMQSENLISDFVSGDERLGYKFGFDQFKFLNNTCGMPFFRWKDSQWVKTDEFDALFDEAFPTFAKNVPEMTFVYRKSVRLSNERVTLPYLVEGNQYNYFFVPTPPKAKVGEPRS